MEKISLIIYAKKPKHFQDLSNTKINIETENLDIGIKKGLEEEIELKRIVNSFYFFPGLLATKNNKEIFLKITAIRNKREVEFQIKTNMQKNFSDSLEEFAVNEMIKKFKVYLKDVLTKKSIFPPNNIFPVPTEIKVFETKKIIIIKQELLFKGEILTSIYFGTIEIRLKNCTLTFETSITLTKEKTIAKYIINGYDKYYYKYDTESLIQCLNTFSKDIISFFNKEGVNMENSFKITKIIKNVDKEKDLNLIVQMKKNPFLQIYKSENYINKIIKEVENNSYSTLLTALIPSLISTKLIKEIKR